MLGFLGTATGGASTGLGLGVEAAGDLYAYSQQGGINNANANIRADQAQIQKQNYNLMELQSNRSSLEVLRRTQQARAQATANATGQGAQFGSGLQGGLANASAEGANNQLGISQNRQIGEAVYTANQDINNQNTALAKYQSNASFGTGLASFGSALAGS